MSDADQFFRSPTLNSPYAIPSRHWELDEQGQPTHCTVDSRRPAKYISPIPKPRKQKGKPKQSDLLFNDQQDQKYDPTPVINELRFHVNQWRNLPNDGHPGDPLHLIVEIKGYRGEDAKDKKSTMDTYWIPGVNNDGGYGRWAFVEFTDVYEMQSDFAKKVEERFDALIASVSAEAPG